MTSKIDNLIRDIHSLLPAPVTEESVDEGVRLIAGEPGEVVVLVLGDVVTFSQFAVEWDGPQTPVRRPLPIANIQWMNILKRDRQRLFTSLVKMIVDRRRKLYRVCQYCEQLKPPEWLHGDTVCMSCAEKHLGVVH